MAVIDARHMWLGMLENDCTIRKITTLQYVPLEENRPEECVLHGG